MKYLFVAFTFLIVIFNKVAAQDYIITHSGDSAFGNIKLRNQTFIVSTQHGDKDFAVDKVKQVHARNFKGTTVAHCNLYLYTDALTDLERDYASTKSIDTVLVLKEIQSTPKINLYFGTDNYKRQYYFYKTPADSVPIQLVVRYHLAGGANANNGDPILNRGDNSRAHVAEIKGYVNQLKAVMKDCTKISNETWESLTYRNYHFKQLIKMFNRCK